jgi:glutamine amidotransferase
MIGIVDYGVGNLFSLSASLKFLGADSRILSEPGELGGAERLILPGVGAFGDAAEKLRGTGMAEAVLREAKTGKFLLGICLGMQLLFEKSFEYGEHAGLGLLPGRVVPLEGDLPKGVRLKIPHMGWNRLEICQNDPLLASCGPDSFVYYVHSYYAKCRPEHVLAGSEYGVFVPGVVRNGNVCGTQFHPEKSGKTGLAILESFLTLS